MKFENGILSYITLLTIILNITFNLLAVNEKEITKGYNTTLLTEPIRSDGTIDYVDAINNINGKGISANNNAAIAILKIIGPDKDYPEINNQLFNLLETRPPEGPYLSDIPRELKKEFNEVLKSPWTKMQHPDLVAWLNSNTKPLSNAPCILEQKHYYMPFCKIKHKSYNSMVADMLPPGIKQIKHLCMTLSIRANMYIGEKQYNKAWADIKVIFHISSIMVQKNETILSYIMAFQNRNFALKSTELLLKSDSVNEHLLKDINDYMQNVNHITLSFLTERYCILDYIANINKYGYSKVLSSYEDNGDTDGILEGTIDKDIIQYVNWNILLTEINTHFDKLENIIQSKTDFNTKINQLKTWEQKYNIQNNEDFFKIYWPMISDGKPAEEASPETKQEIWHMQIPSILLPPISYCITSYYKINAKQQLITVAAALEYYKKTYTTYPNDMQFLITTGIIKEENMMDPFTDNLLAYNNTSKYYTLYSFGFNCLDNDGQNSDELDEVDDIAFSRYKILTTN